MTKKKIYKKKKNSYIKEKSFVCALYSASQSAGSFRLAVLIIYFDSSICTLVSAIDVLF